MKTILQLVLGTALLQPQYPQEYNRWVKTMEVTHQQYTREFPLHQDVVVDFMIRSDSSFDVYDGEERMWVEWYTPNRDSMLVMPGDVDDDGFTIWVKQQQ